MEYLHCHGVQDNLIVSISLAMKLEYINDKVQQVVECLFMPVGEANPALQTAAPTRFGHVSQSYA